LNGGGVLNAIVSNWQINGVYRAQSGIPFQISSSLCNVPAQLNNFCSPGLLAGASPFLQSPSHFDRTQPILNVAAFEAGGGDSRPSVFNFYTGAGPRVQNFRQPGYSDFDIGLQKTIQITERFRFQLRGDAFNIFNQHHFNNIGTFLLSGGTGGSAFNTNVADPYVSPADGGPSGFGTWNGAVTTPRNIQVSGRISF